MIRSTAPVLLPALLIGLAFALRLAMLGVDVRLHPDEALYTAQARLIPGDPLLRTTDLDKPPLTFYVTAFSISLVGDTEFAARLPNVLTSGLSIAVLIALGGAIYADVRPGLLAATWWALSPYDLAFAATVFTDVQATIWVLLAAWLAARDHWRGAGLAMALAFAAKSSAVLYAPLVLALGLLRHGPLANTHPPPRSVFQRVWCFSVTFGAGVALLLLWDSARAPRSFRALAQQRSLPDRWVRADELLPRLEAWAGWLHHLSGHDLANALLLGLGGLGLAWTLIRLQTRAAALDAVLAGYVTAFLALYSLMAFNTYDRYLHTLIPFVLLLLARGWLVLWSALRAPNWTLMAIAGIVIALTLPQTLAALRGEALLGGDQGQHEGIDRAAVFMNTALAGEVIYDHWLGWELAYYLGQQPRVTLLYMPRPAALAADMAAQQHARYFITPSVTQASPWLAALARAGVTVRSVYTDGFVIFELVPPA